MKEIEGIPFLIGFELEVVAFAEGLHFPDGNHIASGPLEHHQVSAVDHAGGTAAAYVVRGVAVSVRPWPAMGSTKIFRTLPHD
jgi:hypothetical protein